MLTTNKVKSLRINLRKEHSWLTVKPNQGFFTAFHTSKGFLGLKGNELHGSSYLLQELLGRQNMLHTISIDTRLNEADTSFVVEGLL